jgi:hypothetical protein
MLIKLTALDVIIGDSRWYRAYANGQHGYVDDVMLDIKPFKWWIYQILNEFHFIEFSEGNTTITLPCRFWGGAIDKTEAERILFENSTKKFLIRESDPSCLEYFLSYK